MFDVERLIDLLGALEQFVDSTQTAMGDLSSEDLSRPPTNGTSSVSSLNRGDGDAVTTGMQTTQQPQPQPQLAGWSFPQFLPGELMCSVREVAGWLLCGWLCFVITSGIGV